MLSYPVAHCLFEVQFATVRSKEDRWEGRGFIRFRIWVGSVSRALSFVERMLSCRYCTRAIAASGARWIELMNLRTWERRDQTDLHSTFNKTFQYVVFGWH